jgi:hypothetical protein
MKLTFESSDGNLRFFWDLPPRNCGKTDSESPRLSEAVTT